MKIVFITMNPFSMNPGHLARLKAVLPQLSSKHEVIILSLHTNEDTVTTKENYPKVKFINLPVLFKGWELKNKKEAVTSITNLISGILPDICILQMEAWELMRELSLSLKKITKFSVVIHAMPFVVSPINPSSDFEYDVKMYLQSNLVPFRHDYVLKHYNEAKKVLNSINIITANNTVSYFLNCYFNNLKIWNYIPLPNILNDSNSDNLSSLDYDFVYMARMEAGKGIEYLKVILREISSILKRKVSILVLGRTDDEKSKKALEDLIKNQECSTYSVTYYGWANDSQKNLLFTKCGVFLYPSHYDNYPTVLNEALSYGLPVVTWEVPFSEINYNNIDSVKLIKLFDYGGFAESAVFCLQNKKFLGKISIEFIKSMPSRESVTIADEKIYEEIIRS